ncbi:unnamed protein product [Ectocarpus sp. 12 AP-2014]
MLATEPLSVGWLNALLKVTPCNDAGDRAPPIDWLKFSKSPSSPSKPIQRCWPQELVDWLVESLLKVRGSPSRWVNNCFVLLSLTASPRTKHSTLDNVTRCTGTSNPPAFTSPCAP